MCDKAEADKAVAGKATAADYSALSKLSAAAALTAATLSASVLSCAPHGGMKSFKLLSVFYKSQQVSASASPIAVVFSCMQHLVSCVCCG